MWKLWKFQRRKIFIFALIFVMLTPLAIISLRATYWTMKHKTSLNIRAEKITLQSSRLEGLPTNNTSQRPAPEWKGFGPERGLYNFTVVTALLDIGRGQWSQQMRSYEEYLQYLHDVLVMDVNLVVFIDAKGKPFVDKVRRGREKRTRVVVTSLVGLPYYRYRDRIAEIMNSKEYKKSNKLVEKKLCEATIPEYDIITLSKLYFLNRTLWENPFSSSYFMWIDGGYSHGKDVFPKNNLWIPKSLFEYPDKVTIIERQTGLEAYAGKTDLLHKENIAVVVGAFLAGGADVLKEVCVLQSLVMEEWMERGVVDDDQTMLTTIYSRKPSLFRTARGDWFDVFRLFNAN